MVLVWPWASLSGSGFPGELLWHLVLPVPQEFLVVGGCEELTEQMTRPKEELNLSFLLCDTEQLVTLQGLESRG